LEEMKAMVPSEDNRFKMAFITAKQLGIDKSKLIESGQHYIQVLNEDLREFQANLSSFVHSRTLSKEKSSWPSIDAKHR
jgi:hypothetical protein